MLGLKLFAAALALVAIVLIPPAVGQEVQSIAAVVNDEVISIYDLDQRVRLLIKTARIEDTAASRQRVRQRVLRGLIDEKLQLQEAARYNTSVTDADLERGVRLVERQNNMKPGDLERFFKANQVSFDVFVDRLRAEIAWTKLIARRLRPTLRIGEDEIDEAEKQVNEDKDKPAFLISEIFFPVDSADDDVEIRTTAERVVGDIKGGARFAEMARQYSSGVTAFEGGNVGWVRPGQLAAEVTAALAAMERGQVSPPIRTAPGYYVIHVRDRRSPNEPDKATVTLKQIVFPLAQNAAAADIDNQRRLAESISSTINKCDDVDGAIARLKSPESGDLGTLDVKDLPAEFQSIVLKLPIGKASPPIMRPGSLHVIIVCDRKVDSIEIPDREAIARALGNTRLGLMARRYLRDLTRDAIVELR